MVGEDFSRSRVAVVLIILLHSNKGDCSQFVNEASLPEYSGRAFQLPLWFG
jgi:hypothetical protein